MTQDKPVFAAQVTSRGELQLLRSGAGEVPEVLIAEVVLDGGSVVVDVREPAVPHSVTITHARSAEAWVGLVVGDEVASLSVVGSAGRYVAGPLTQAVTRLAMAQWLLRHRPADGPRPLVEEGALAVDVLLALDDLAPFHAYARREVEELPLDEMRSTLTELDTWARQEPASVAGIYADQIDRAIDLLGDRGDDPPPSTAANREVSAPVSADTPELQLDTAGLTESGDADWTALGPGVLHPGPAGVRWSLRDGVLSVRAEGFPGRAAQDTPNLVVRAYEQGGILPAAYFPLQRFGHDYVGRGPALVLGDPSAPLRVEVFDGASIVRPVSAETWNAGVRARAEARSVAAARVARGRTADEPALLAERVAGDLDHRVSACIAELLDVPGPSGFESVRTVLSGARPHAVLLDRSHPARTGNPAPATFHLPGDGTVERLTGSGGTRPVAQVTVAAGVVTVVVPLGSRPLPGHRAAVVVQAWGRRGLGRLQDDPARDPDRPGGLLVAEVPLPGVLPGDRVEVRFVALDPDA